MEFVSSTEEKTRSALLDLDVLSCPICVEPLTIPIFQCENGHLACSYCCTKLSNKCHSCASPLGYIRCRGMEGILESVFVPCRNAKFGCSQNVSYWKGPTHEKECNCYPCSCPVQDCNHTGSYKDLYVHYKSIHIERYGFSRPPMRSRFDFGEPFRAHINISDKILIKREKTKSLLFAVQCFREPCGVYVTVNCIAPSISEVGEFSYDICYNTENGHTVIYKSPEVKRVLELSFPTPQDDFMLIPHSLLRGELLDLKLCIKDLNQE